MTNKFVGFLSWTAEFGPHGVRVNTISPGPARTEGASRMGDFLDQLAAQAPAGRVASPEEITAAIIFLATGSSSDLLSRHMF
ncbi:SDR family oxidoreductase [Paenibacillus sepulcri]|uniref:SDR family oxidoreductase n=1 Tax=Paenibacillus sepulcri TaxID=359917 RepID=A0ABS7CIG1_9BACL|nr:SDR family oxidoreductase [Paenibacillus sepulcri]